MGTGGTTVFDTAAGASGFVLDEDQRRVAARLTGLLRGHRRGVYVWGPVGRGKSWLTTVLFDAVGTPHKRRLHFHEFFRDFHAAYARHRDKPRAAIIAVDELLGRCRLLCFDEFHVHDPGDAMLVGLLMRALFDRGIVVVATSNYRPAELMPNPLYHHLFEPVIAMIESAMDVVELAGETDYRQVGGQSRSNFERGAYVWPGTDEQLDEIGLVRADSTLTVSGREVRVEAVGDGLVWFDFAELCDTPTSTIDYLELADRYVTWVISGLPATCSRDAGQRFANVIDVLCDRDVRLILVGERPLAEFAPSSLDFARTASRLSLLDHGRHRPDRPVGSR